MAQLKLYDPDNLIEKRPATFEDLLRNAMGDQKEAVVRVFRNTDGALFIGGRGVPAHVPFRIRGNIVRRHGD